ncbi:Peroxisomal membrane associated protein 20 [Pseudocercospora fuligena]|uniref:Peroxisomal membrane associated protein 20 n=1 Tax=Pseudocercospora fuligena TaxID=685502 RepID=A0A8H6RSW8_9PEZI|nr:Peroxisomal membrane associated protein 20 [Pseudocercospora fuligena]
MTLRRKMLTMIPISRPTYFAARRILSAHETSFRERFHKSSATMVKVGDTIPNVELFEGAPDKKVDIGKELSSGKGLIVTIPAAYSPHCTASHIPGYIANPKLKDAGKVFVVSINDPFVMKAWSEQLDPEYKSGIRYLGDVHGELIKALDLEFDSKAIFGVNRSKRAAIRVQDGKVESFEVEPDNVGVSVTAAEKILA